MVWGWVPETLTAGARPCPPLPRCDSFPTPCLEAGFGRYCTYSAGFTHSDVSRNPWSQGFGHVGYCTYPPNTCKTRAALALQEDGDLPTQLTLPWYLLPVLPPGPDSLAAVGWVQARPGAERSLCRSLH